jgi:hypothetical protein
MQQNGGAIRRFLFVLGRTQTKKRRVAKALRRFNFNRFNINDGKH